MRVVVLPDIHGRLDAMESMLKHSGLVDGRLSWKGGRGDRLVQLGDLVDRGPETKACVELAMRLKKDAGSGMVVLKGNHEDLLLCQHESDDEREHWLVNGGTATESSYGDKVDLIRPGGEHWNWMKALPTYWVLHQVLFTHGGLQADAPDAMDDESLMWSRPPLVTGKYRALVVGHTPTQTGRIEMEDNVFLCDLGLAYHHEASLQYLDMMITPKRLKWTVRVAE